MFKKGQEFWQKQSKTKKRWIVASVIVLVVLIGVVWGVQRLNTGGLSMPGTTMLRKVTVEKKEFKETISGSGSIQAIDRAVLLARIPGVLREILVEDEQNVEKDQVLYVIESAQTEVALEQATYNAALAKRNYDQLAWENQAGSTDIRDAALAVTQAKATYLTAVENRNNLQIVADAPGVVTDLPLKVGESFAMNTPLVYVGDDNGGVETENEILLQKARHNLQIAQEVVDALQLVAAYAGQVFDIPVAVGDNVTTGQLLMKVEEVGRDRSDATAYQLRISQAENTLKTRREAYEQLEVKASTSGRISDLTLKIGDMVTPQTIIALVGNTDHMEVDLMVAQNHINGIKVGNAANLTVSAVNTTYRGFVKSVSQVWSIQNGVVSYPVTVVIDQKDERLAVGMSVVASITSSDEQIYGPSGLRGNLKSASQKTVTSKSGGKVIALHSESQKWVNEGDLLVTLQNDDVRVAYELALKEYQDAVATNLLAKSSASVSRILVKAGDNIEKGQLLMTLQSHLAEANLKQAEKEFSDLYAKGNHRYSAKVSGRVESISVKPGQRVAAGDVLLSIQNEDVLYAAGKAEANLAAAQAAYQAVLQNPGSGALAKAWVSYVQAEANLNDAERNHGYLTVKAPISGKVYVKPTIEVGDQLSADTQLATVYDMSVMQLVVNIDEIDVAKIETGMSCRVTLDALPDRLYEGFVSRISQEGTAKDGVATYAVTVNVPNPTLIKTAMTATADIILFTLDNAIAIPKSALQAGGETADQKMVYVVNARNGLEERIVSIGKSTETMVVIVSGLNEGETVVTTKIGKFQ